MVNRILGTTVALCLLGYGVVRIGVGTLLLAQSSGIIDYPDLSDGVTEVNLFIVSRANDQILTFSLNGYFLYIVAMGILLSAGALGIISRARWGFKTLALYIGMHAALFVNFQEINPKILGLILQIILLLYLYYLMPAKKKFTE